MKTDGFICTSPGDNWEYQNTGSAGARAQMSPTASAYVRVERCGAIAGTQVDENGAVSDGPVVQFTDPNGLLAGAAAAGGQRPWIVWAGVSPLSLTEVLIVWNAPIVLLSKAKIGGGQVTTVVGRLMVVQLSEPVAIHGGEVHDLEIKGGAVGVYSDGGPVCPALVNPPGGGGGGGQLSDLCALPEECGCGEVYPQDAPDDGQGQGGQAMPPLWSTMCNPDAQCGEVEDQRAQFIPNNGMRVPVRCCHPFVLVQAFNCGPSGECGCQDAQVWQASMTFYGTTLPLDLFGLDKLVDIDPCCISNRWPNGYPGVLLGDIDCVPECKVQYSVEIVAAGGPQVIVQGYWMPQINGYSGQSVLWKPPCGQYCEDEDLNCVPLIASDEVDCFVDEDIIKPIERTSPVSFFEDFILTTEEFTIYQTTTVGFKETQITGFEETAADVVTQFQTVDTNIPNWELGEPVEIPKYTTEDQSVVTTVMANNRDIPNIDCDTAVEVVTNINSLQGNINGISDIVYATVSAIALNHLGDFELLENQIGHHTDGWPGFWAAIGEPDTPPDLPTAVVTEVEVVDAGFGDSYIVYRDQGQIPIELILSHPDYSSLRKTSLDAVTDVNFSSGPITAFTAETPQDIITSITPQKKQINVPNVAAPVNAGVGLLQGAPKSFLSGPSVVVATDLEYATITACVNGEPTPLAVATGFKEHTIPVDSITPVTALDSTPITGVTPGDAVQVVTDVASGMGQVTGVAQDGDPVLVVTDISSTTQPGEFLSLADGLPEAGDIPVVTHIEHSGGVYYPTAEAFQTIAVGGNTQDVEIEWERRFSPTITPVERRMAQQNIVYANDVVLSPQNAVTAIQQQKASITPAKCDGTISVVTAIDEQKDTVKGVEQDGEPVIVREVDKLEDLTIKIIGTEIQTFDIPAFNEKTYDVLVRDELGEDSFVVMNPDDFDVYQALVPDAEGDITLITSTDPGCTVTYKFLNHDGTPWEWTDASVTPADCCEGQPNELGADTQPLPIEIDCKNFVLLSGKYVNQPKGTEERCPCYDGVAELACNQPENVQEPPPSGGPNPCSMRVRRIRRQFCVQCNPKSEERSC